MKDWVKVVLVFTGLVFSGIFLPLGVLISKISRSRAGLLLLPAVLLVAGCISPVLTAREAREMSPEQIEAFRKAGQKVVGCFRFGGPPPAGATTWLILPDDSKPTLKFGSDCAIIQGDISSHDLPGVLVVPSDRLPGLLSDTPTTEKPNL